MCTATKCLSASLDSYGRLVGVVDSFVARRRHGLLARTLVGADCDCADEYCVCVAVIC
jgi:hypothetical protein